MVRVIYSGKTDVGKRRAVNQDNFIIKEYPGDVTLAVVCDGMGGANGGATASEVASKAFVEYIDKYGDRLGELIEAGAREDFSMNADTKELDISEGSSIPVILTAAVSSANEAVFSKSTEDPGLLGMGTTLVATVASGKDIYAANVGDSRMYVITDGGIRQITRDHSYVQHLVDLGRMSPKKAKTSKRKNIITRAVGTEAKVKTDIFRVDRDRIPEDDEKLYILLCSDGLTNMLETSEIAEIVRGAGDGGEEKLGEATDALVDLANERGGADNITVVILSM